jgi:hypothetical protein
MVINQINIKDNFSASYEKMLKTLQMVQTKNNFLYRHHTPKLSDIELIALLLTSEFFDIDSECQLFRIMPSYLQSKIERSVYNRRAKGCFSIRRDCVNCWWILFRRMKNFHCR